MPAATPFANRLCTIGIMVFMGYKASRKGHPRRARDHLAATGWLFDRGLAIFGILVQLIAVEVEDDFGGRGSRYACNRKDPRMSGSKPCWTIKSDVTCVSGFTTTLINLPQCLSLQ